MLVIKLAEITKKAVIVIASNYASNVKVLVILFFHMGPGSKRGVTRVAPYMAFPPFFKSIL